MMSTNREPKGLTGWGSPSVFVLSRYSSISLISFILPITHRKFS